MQEPPAARITEHLRTTCWWWDDGWIDNALYVTDLFKNEVRMAQELLGMSRDEANETVGAACGECAIAVVRSVY